MGFFYIAPQLGRCILLILRFFVGIGLLSIPTFWMVGQARAAADIPVSSSLLPLSQLAPPGSNLDPTRIYIGAEQTQDFFTPQGFATVKTDDAGRWSKISLTNDVINQYETGVITLNTRIDMTHDFSFSWQVQMQKGAGAIAMADGIGFALHPIYAANSGADQPGKQDMTAYGRTGGNLGTADLMNAFGFKLDSFYNSARPTGPVANTGFGSALHKGDAYAAPDDIIAGQLVPALAKVDPNKGQWGPFGVFTQTDATGYMTYPAAAPDPVSGGQPEQVPLTGQTRNAVNLINGQWAALTIVYTAASHQLQVSLADPADTARQLTWTRTLTAQEQALIHTAGDKYRYYAFSILGSTGQWAATQNIQRLSGYFTPESPTLIVRQTTANGTALAPPVTTIVSTGTAYSAAPIHTVPSAANGQFKGVLSHILLTYYVNGQPVTQRVPASNYRGDGPNSNKWYYYPTPSAQPPLTVVTYVYRSMDPAPTPVFSFSDQSEHPGTAAPFTLQPKKTVYVTAQLTNPANGPTEWVKPFALITVPALLQSVNKATSNQSGQQLQVQFPTISRDSTGTVTFPLTYIGQVPAVLYPDKLPAGNGLNLALHGYLYDQSPLNLARQTVLTAATAGPRTDSSYFYDFKTLDAPQANPPLRFAPDPDFNATDLDPGNFVPQFGSRPLSATATFRYWDIADTTSTSVDPIKAGLPVQDISGTTPGTFTGLAGETIANAPRPLPLPGYDYIGYYEYGAFGQPSIWHQAKDTPANFYYTLPTTVTKGAVPQTIAYIYRPNSTHFLALTIPDLDFGQQSAATAGQTDLNLPLQAPVQTAIRDQRPRGKGLPAASGAWQVSVAATGPLTGATTKAAVTGAQLVFNTPTVTGINPILGDPGITAATGRLPLAADGGELTLAQAAAYGSGSLRWDPAGIQLAIPQQPIQPDKYQTTITWTVKDGL